MSLMTNRTTMGGRGTAAKSTPAKAAKKAAPTKAAAKKTTPAKKAAPVRKTAAASQPPPPPPPGVYDLGGVPTYWDGTAWVETPPPAASATAAGDAVTTVELGGRRIAVVMPSAEQLVMWQRIANRLSGLNAETVEPGRVMKMLDQVISIIRSVMADEEDGDWVEDQILEGRVNILDAAKFVADAVTLLGGQAKPAAPTTGPVVRRRRT